ncbi:hypothetical protein FOA52_003703 [Chlamydomonas sp. UWO 241]|nr:hypothetical protein FOA52_003703 [Chlamydomonas sp. UWO 241]
MQQRPEPGSLSEADLRSIHEQWARFWGPVSPADRNRLLAQSMKELTEGDPWALDMAKQDGKEYVTGAISAVELRDRFVSIFSPAGGRAACEGLFKEMAMLVPPRMRARLLAECADPWVLPRERVAMLAQMQAQMQQAQAQQQQQQRPPGADAAALGIAAAAASPSGASGVFAEGAAGEDRYEDDEEEEEDEEGGTSAMLLDQAQDYEDYEEGADGEEDDEGGGAGAGGGSVSAREEVREFKGWQVLDRARILGMAQQILADGALRDPAESATGSAGLDTRARRARRRGEPLPASAQLPPGAPGRASAQPGGDATVGAAGSMSSRPAQKAGSKKAKGGRVSGAGGAAVAGSAPDASANVVVWLRADLRLHDNPALAEAAKAAAERGGTVTLLYVHSPEEDGGRPPGDDGLFVRRSGGGAASSSSGSSGSASSMGNSSSHSSVGGGSEGSRVGSSARATAPRPPPGAAASTAGAAAGWRPGGASRLWLHMALSSLDADLEREYGPGARVVLRRGPYAEAVRQVAAAVGARRVYFNRRYEPASLMADEAVTSALVSSGFELHSFNGSLLREPWEVRVDMGGTAWRGHFGSLSPYAAAHARLGTPAARAPLPPPRKLPVAGEAPRAVCAGLALEALGLYTPPHVGVAPRQRDGGTVNNGGTAGGVTVSSGTADSGTESGTARDGGMAGSGTEESDGASVNTAVNTAAAAAAGHVVDWGAGLRAEWRASESEARQLLDSFLSTGGGLERYEEEHGRADGRGVSRLSPYIRWGQLSPREVWARTEAAGGKALSKTFSRRLIWRDLAYWQLHHWPEMHAVPIRAPYARHAWASGADADAALAAWQAGRTGYPLVDAGMRELRSTGWMQQSMRMACACLLTEYLNVDWVAGAAWFHDNLVDADLAVNSMMWQNAGKSGLDQWQYTVSPTSRDAARDPDGSYIRRWVLELAALPTEHLHAPWTAPGEVLSSARVTLGETYPHRVSGGATLAQLRDANVRAIWDARGHPDASGWSDPRGYDLIVAPKGSSVGLDGTKVVVFTAPEYRRGAGGSGGGGTEPAGASSVGTDGGGGVDGGRGGGDGPDDAPAAGGDGGATGQPGSRAAAPAAAKAVWRGGKVRGGKQTFAEIREGLMSSTE